MEKDSCNIETMVGHNHPELVTRSAKPEGSIVKINGVEVGGEALCDGSQSLFPEEFDTLMKDLEKVAEAVGRRIHKL